MSADLYTWPPSPTRWDLINACIAKHAYVSYLEIGCAHNQCFNKIKCDRKVGVDPRSGGTHRMTSDAFFETHDDTFDIVFVDGLHIQEQAYRDVENALKRLNRGGTILMHDCLPMNERVQVVPQPSSGSWTGDVWKAVFGLYQREDIEMIVTLIDSGVGVLRPGTNHRRLPDIVDRSTLTWDDFVTHHEQWFDLKSYTDALIWI